MGQADYYTLASAAVGAGLTLGSLFTYRLLNRIKPLSLVFISFPGYSVGVPLLSESTVLVLATLVCFLMGAAGAFGFTTYEYLWQRLVPSALRGRVFTIMDAMMLLPLPLGYLAIGYAAERSASSAQASY